MTYPVHSCVEKLSLSQEAICFVLLEALHEFGCCAPLLSHLCNRVLLCEDLAPCLERECTLNNDGAIQALPPRCHACTACLRSPFRVLARGTLSTFPPRKPPPLISWRDRPVVRGLFRIPPNLREHPRVVRSFGFLPYGWPGVPSVVFTEISDLLLRITRAGKKHP